MAREILILRRLDHPMFRKLHGLVTSRMSCSLYLVFDYMEHDLAGLASSPGIKFTEPQVKCFMHQLLSGLEHCHNRHVLHRDIKGSNLLVDNGGVLKIADFGLASTFDPNNKQPMTSRVVTLWYRPPELLLGATDYGVGVDLWSAGCILAELFARKPIMTGRTEVEQLHRIFKLCGSPSEEYWKKSKLPHATIFKPQQAYKRCIAETFKDFPQSSLPLIETLLTIDPAERQTATAALKSEFFTTVPYACDPSSLPKYPPSKEMDAKRRDEEARRLRVAGKAGADGAKKTRPRDRARAIPAPGANAELQTNIDRRRLITHANAKSKSEKFPPPHQDGGIGYRLGSSHHIDPGFDPPDVPFTSMNLSYAKEPMQTWSGPLVEPNAVVAPRRKPKPSKKDPRKDKDSTRNKEKESI
ncbi:putative serine/threonine-protein kinase [Forsythia ovata]|uniref:Serine/threonine-protein kinase n=1 Tax=Forsythia ovata TaxID=205694 RepID=A0ABD1PL39_9LAMI